MKSAEKKDMILEAIVRYIQLHGYPPTFREIGEMVRINSLSQVHEYIRQMIEDGELQTDANGSTRALRVPGYRFEKVEVDSHGEAERVYADTEPV